jgi:pimeloyl-ACP methyl ester carboxylesterase
MMAIAGCGASSKRTDGVGVTTLDEHADDLHRLISVLGAGAADIFATSGGAVNALALAARRPEQVRTLVAHEPPAAPVLPDRQALLAASTGRPSSSTRR